MLDDAITWLTQGTLPEIDWNYALVTLAVRFIMVFLVLWMIQGAMQLLAYSVRDKAGNGDSADSPAASSGDSPTVADTGMPDDLTVAAIGVALELESHPEAFRIPLERRSSTWAVAGRVTAKRSSSRS